MRFLLTLSALLIGFSALAQFSAHECGSHVEKLYTKQQINNVKQASQTAEAPDTCVERTFSIVAWVFRDSLGNPGLTDSTINEAIGLANLDFERTCMQFDVCQVVYIDNFKYNHFKRQTEEPELQTLYYKPEYINMYFCERVISGTDTVGGYAWFPGGPDIVVISKENVVGTKTISHELGHFFGLYHTFEDAFGAETMDGTNCTTAGDLVCDTEPDHINAIVDATCNMTSGHTDPNGQFLLVPANNIMSYHPDNCRELFSPGQASRMVWNYLNNRNYLR